MVAEFPNDCHIAMNVFEGLTDDTSTLILVAKGNAQDDKIVQRKELDSSDATLLKNWQHLSARLVGIHAVHLALFRLECETNGTKQGRAGNGSAGYFGVNVADVTIILKEGSYEGRVSVEEGAEDAQDQGDVELLGCCGIPLDRPTHRA